jgi:hypothetical protein
LDNVRVPAGYHDIPKSSVLDDFLNENENKMMALEKYSI